MKSFQRYLIEQGIDIDADFHGKGLGGSDGKKDPESLIQIVKYALDDHYDVIMQCLKDIGKKDPRIQDKLDELNRTALNDPKPFGQKGKLPRAGGDGLGHEVVPNMADRADGGGEIEGT